MASSSISKILSYLISIKLLNHLVSKFLLDRLIVLLKESERETKRERLEGNYKNKQLQCKLVEK